MQELIVGNHDTILLFGSDIQSDLRDFSKSMSKILLSKNRELDYLLMNILNELNEFQNDTNTSISIKKHRKFQPIKYRELIEYIDKFTLALQLQQAQLLKEMKILEMLMDLVERCSEALDESILYAEKISESKRSYSMEENVNLWFSRLDHKINDLKISKTLSLQSKAQIMMLHKNDLLLIDKASTAITQTIPIWRNQICILLGMEKFNNSIQVNNSISDKINSNIQNISKRSKFALKNKKTESFDLTELIKINENLKTALSELSEIRNEDVEIKEKIVEILN